MWLALSCRPTPAPSHPLPSAARLWGHSSLWLHVKRSNAAAQALYLGQGFRPLGGGLAAGGVRQLSELLLVKPLTPLRHGCPVLLDRQQAAEWALRKEKAATAATAAVAEQVLRGVVGMGVGVEQAGGDLGPGGNGTGQAGAGGQEQRTAGQVGPDGELVRGVSGSVRREDGVFVWSALGSDED